MCADKYPAWLSSGTVSFNLLPYRQIRATHHRRWRYGECAIAALTGLFFAIAMQYCQWHGATQPAHEQKMLEAVLARLAPRLAESKTLLTHIKSSEKRHQALAALIPERQAFAILLAVLGHINLPGLTITAIQHKPETTILMGIAASQTALTQAVRILQQSGHFAPIAVTQVNSLAQQNTRNLSFSLRVSPRKTP